MSDHTHKTLVEVPVVLEMDDPPTVALAWACTDPDCSMLGMLYFDESNVPEAARLLWEQR